MNVSAAAMKSKLFADQEEREVQRLAATVINHQVSMCSYQGAAAPCHQIQQA